MLARTVMVTRNSMDGSEVLTETSPKFGFRARFASVRAQGGRAEDGKLTQMIIDDGGRMATTYGLTGQTWVFAKFDDKK